MANCDSRLMRPGSYFISCNRSERPPLALSTVLPIYKSRNAIGKGRRVVGLGLVSFRFSGTQFSHRRLPSFANPRSCTPFDSSDFGDLAKVWQLEIDMLRSQSLIVENESVLMLTCLYLVDTAPQTLHPLRYPHHRATNQDSTFSTIHDEPTGMQSI